MPRGYRRVKEDGGDRRTQLVDLTVELLLEKGFASVSTRDLAERAGLSRSHIYHYFKDWPTLRREAFIRFASRQLNDMKSAVGGKSPRDAIVTFVRECLPSGQDDGLVIWLDAWDEALRDKKLAEAYTWAESEWSKILADAIQQGRSDGIFRCASAEKPARQIFAMTMGYCESLLLSSTEQRVSAAVTELEEAALILVQDVSA